MRHRDAMLWLMIVHPRQAARGLSTEKGIRRSLRVVVLFGVVFTIALLWTQAIQAYPLPAEQARVWREAGMAYAIDPFLTMPPETYRLAQALMAIPLVLAIWVLMAGTGRLLAIGFGGKGSFEQYLNVFGFSFFALWGATLIVDNVYNAFLREVVAPALPLAPVGLERAIVVYAPSILGTLGVCLAGVYNGIAARELEGFSLAKAILMGVCTLFWPFLLATAILR